MRKRAHWLCWLRHAVKLVRIRRPLSHYCRQTKIRKTKHPNHRRPFRKHQNQIQHHRKQSRSPSGHTTQMCTQKWKIDHHRNQVVPMKVLVMINGRMVLPACHRATKPIHPKVQCSNLIPNRKPVNTHRMAVIANRHRPIGTHNVVPAQSFDPVWKCYRAAQRIWLPWVRISQVLQQPLHSAWIHWPHCAVHQAWSNTPIQLSVHHSAVASHTITLLCWRLPPLVTPVQRLHRPPLPPPLAQDRMWAMHVSRHRRVARPLCPCAKIHIAPVARTHSTINRWWWVPHVRPVARSANTRNTD